MADVSVRRAEHGDAAAIRALIEEVGEGDLKSRFGTIDVDYIIEHTELSVVAAADEDDSSTIVAFAAFSSRCPQYTTEAWLDYTDPAQYSVRKKYFDLLYPCLLSLFPMFSLFLIFAGPKRSLV